MDNLIIRKAREGELKSVQELNQELFVHDEEFDPLLNIDWPFEKSGEEYFKDKISGKEGVCFVAEVDKEIVGYLVGGMMKTYSYRKIKKQSELENILVKENFRGQRLGEKLFQEFIKWSKEKGVDRIKVCAYSQNHGAINFYKRIGFVPYEINLEYEVVK